MTELKFRIATTKDAPQIQALVQSSFRAIDNRADWTGHAELASHFKVTVDEVLAILAKEDTVTLNAVAASGGDDADTLVATIDVSKRGTDVGHLSMIAVDERFQQGGVGRQVLQYAEQYCRETWGVGPDTKCRPGIRPTRDPGQHRRPRFYQYPVTPRPRSKSGNQTNARGHASAWAFRKT